jgi:hypothetical protein
MLNVYFDEIPGSSNSLEWNNVLSIEIITDVASEPVSVADIKSHLRIQHSGEDAYLSELIKEAREQLEDEHGAAFAPKTIKVQVRNQKGNIKLPLWTPNGTITEITDQDGEVIVDTSYDIYNGVVETKFTDPVYVEYTTGFATLPNKYKRQLKERVEYLYSNRGDQKKTTSGSWII